MSACCWVPGAVAALVLGCGAASGARRGITSTAQGETRVARGASTTLSGDAMRLEALRMRVAEGDAAALRAVGVSLEPAGGAREMTGEAASDERIARAEVIGRADDSAAMLVVTSCGNVTLSTLRWERERWTSAEHVPLVRELHPGRCGQTEARAEAVALSSDARREIVVVIGTQDATGESVRGPFLSVYQLRAGGVLGALLRDAPFGGTDDETGASTTAEYYVVEDVPPPRDLHVAIRPGHLGPGGAPPSQIVHRRYVLRGARLVIAQESTEPVEP